MKINKGKKFNSFLPIAIINFAFLFMIIMCILGIREDSSNLKSTLFGLGIVIILLVSLDILFWRIRKNLFSLVYLEELKISMYYGKKIISSMNISDIIFVFLVQDTIYLCSKKPESLDSKSVNRVLFDKDTIKFRINKDKLNYILSIINISALYVNKRTFIEDIDFPKIEKI